MAKPPIRVSLISLGCPKNLVDSEVMVGKLAGGPFALQTQPSGADVVVVNTCGFIDPAKEESVDTICEMLELKSRGAVKGVVVAGCMVRRYGGELARDLPDVDAFLDLSDYADAPDVFRRIVDRRAGADSPARADAIAPFVGGGNAKSSTSDFGRALLTLPHTAYLRISEGCDRKCAFCAIPLIRGTQRSKPIEVLVEEARALAAAGVKELSLVGEETTAYASDLGVRYGEGIAPLLRALSEVEGIRWIRLLYAHPGSFKPSLVAELRDNPKVAKYVDIPVQHGDAEVLKRMKRGTPPEKIVELVATLRAEVPGITLRTTILVGFPGETDRRFENLLELLTATRFERVGCFNYSREEGTASHAMTGRVPVRVAAERRRRVMLLSRRITRERNKRLQGQDVTVLVDDADGERAVGRTEGDAPQIDCRVLLRRGEGPALKAGRFLRARVEGVEGYDLKAVATGTAQR